MSSSGSTSAQGCDCCVICWHELSPQIPRNGFYVYALTSATRPVPLINDHDGRLSEDQKARLKVYLLMQEIPEYIAQKKYEDLKDSLDCTTKVRNNLDPGVQSHPRSMTYLCPSRTSQIVKRFRESGLLQQPHPAEGPSQELAALYDETIKLCPTCRTHLTMLESPGIIIVPEFCEDLDNAWQAEIERRSRGEEHLSLWKVSWLLDGNTVMFNSNSGPIFEFDSYRPQNNIVAITPTSTRSPSSPATEHILPIHPT